ncbi:MAG: type I DNA topoisomerase [Candidatus Liptonbacteria bacterium]|nr:type I DNA topoisomerase [Candidatus Liptonbacteria bacterium]
MKLVIVESPTKAKTIGKFLGKNFEVESSYGHVRDLPKSKFGIDVEHDFAPTYTIPVKAKDVIKNLQNRMEKAEGVILATDEDREGEAIAWHLVQALGLNGKEQRAKSKRSAPLPSAIGPLPIERIAFHEITKPAIEEALKNPREIDMNLVDAQQARRVLDRMVGYELSPFLWRKIRYGLSAGRVQSVAVRLIVEREREIQKFKSEEYWSVEADFAKGVKGNPFRTRLVALDGKSLGKMDIKDGDSADKIVSRLKNKKYAVQSVTVKDVLRNPAPPFTTSTLQQEAARKLGFSAKQTMVIAQQLYENGHITYMRTDSVSLASSALAQAKSVIADEFGAQYALDVPRVYTAKSKGAQEAHEAIRPTDLSRRGDLFQDRGQNRLYGLIWKRTLASQMRSAEMEQTAVDVIADDKSGTFRANGQRVVFDGFIRVYTEGRDDQPAGGADEDYQASLPKLAEGDALTIKKIDPLRHFTEPLPRYTDATLIKVLEAEGIGRPSTYAPTLSTIQAREYVEKIEKKYHPTEIGMVVNDLLVEHFPEIVDIKFTSHVEEEFDSIAEGKIKWTEVMREFYTPFKKHLAEKEESVLKHTEVSDTPCPHCGKPMIMKFGRMGKFLVCPDPESKVTLPMPEEAAKIKELQEKTKDERCPLCGKPMDVKRGRFGFFLGCSDYPKCKGVSRIWNKTGFKCPNCKEQRAKSKEPDAKDDKQLAISDKQLIGDIVEKKSRGRGKPFWACTRFPDCAFVMNKRPENEDELNAAYKEWRAKPSPRLSSSEAGRTEDKKSSGAGENPPKPKR